MTENNNVTAEPAVAATNAVATESNAPAASVPGAPKSHKKNIIIAIVAVLAALGLWALVAPTSFGNVAGCVLAVVAPDKYGPPAKKVGSIDQEVIFGLEEFKKAETDMKAFSEKKKKEFEAAVKAKGNKQEAQAELQTLYRKINLEIEQENNKILNPLQTRAEAAVALVARSKGLTVVLDKRIVVFGVPDITEDVKKAFQQKGELTLPAETDTSSSAVAYFDQSVVRSLKVFTEAEMKLYNYRNDMVAEYEKRAASLSPQEKEALQREMSAKFDALKEQIMTPLYQKVTASVNQVAKAQSISLVLDKQNVMYGGRNITDSVVETFLGNVANPSSTTTGAAGAAATSSPVASPAAGK